MEELFVSCYIDLFSPETYAGFSSSDRKISGFRESHHGLAQTVQPGDLLICYVTRVSR